MDTNRLKQYAPKARQDFIAAVTRRAAKFGLTAGGVSPVSEEGQLIIIEGQPYPKTIGALRRKLAERIKAQSFQQVMEAVAYTWFNRLAAIRFMELHGYLDHSFRVLSHPAGSALPEILEHAQNVDLPGLDRERVVDLKMDGTRDEELYRDLLLAQCHALHQAMPFLFERVDDETELLLPDLLLQTDSLIRDLVTEIPEEDWQEIEIIGWLYQFYISEKKDQVIGKVVKSEDIPAATQLFTPNWIVKYMVQNSLGAQWLATYPQSPLKGQMEYYIEPAEQDEEVDSGKWIVNSEEGLSTNHYPLSTSSQLSTNHYPLSTSSQLSTSLNPEELTLIDPACGSGHILVEAYDLFKGIYLERGYRQRDVAKLILEKNLFGLDIDGRAAQLTGFALMMKGRADDRRLFERGVTLNVMALVDSTAEVNSGKWLVDSGIEGAEGLADAVDELVSLFRHATTYGSLIQVPEGLAAKLPVLKQLSEESSQDIFVSDTLKRLRPLVQQAKLLASQYDAVVANPPYMGSKSFNSDLKGWIKGLYHGYDKDLFSVFIVRILILAKVSGHASIMTSFAWMFLASFEQLRRMITTTHTISSLVQLHYDAFVDAKAHVCTFTLKKKYVPNYRSSFVRLAEFPGVQDQAPKTLEAIRNRACDWFFESAPDDFRKIPGSPIAYWASASLAKSFEGERLDDHVEIKGGMSTSNNLRFLRLWPEVSRRRIGFSVGGIAASVASEKSWFPYSKGGKFRRWYGNNDYLVNWRNDGEDVKRAVVNNPSDPNTTHWSRRIFNTEYFFCPSVTWGDIGSGVLSARRNGRGFIHDSVGVGAYGAATEAIEQAVLALLNSSVSHEYTKILCPTSHFNAGPIGAIPFLKPIEAVAHSAERCVLIARADWDAYERSWDFQSLPILSASADPTPTLKSSYTTWTTKNRETIAEMKRLEEENNRLFIDAYGLADELTPDVPTEQITLTVNPAYRYGKKVDSEKWIVDRGFGEELETRFRQDTMKELVSYAIGCMMGRYRLDRPGLIYAHSGNERFWEIYKEVDSGEEVDSDKWIVNREETRGAEEQLSTNHYSLSTSATTNHYPLSTCLFPPDEDAIVPLTDTEWFDDDAANRLVEFISVAWPGEEVNSGKWIVNSEEIVDNEEALSTNHYSLSTSSPLSTSSNLEDNLTFLADNLSPKKTEASRDTIRRYLCDGFFKDHLKTYKKRPIYWLFSSGKQKAFQCLVYLHRYNEGTLARMRMEYVVPLQGKMAARIDKLADDVQAASTSAQAKRLQKERDKLTRQLEELRRYDEQLRHYADLRIKLDLDDGVKVNYGKFGNLLAEVKAVTGKTAK